MVRQEDRFARKPAQLVGVPELLVGLEPGQGLGLVEGVAIMQPGIGAEDLPAQIRAAQAEIAGRLTDLAQ